MGGAEDEEGGVGAVEKAEVLAESTVDSVGVAHVDEIFRGKERVAFEFWRQKGFLDFVIDMGSWEM